MEDSTKAYCRLIKYIIKQLYAKEIMGKFMWVARTTEDEKSSVNDFNYMMKYRLSMLEQEALMHITNGTVDGYCPYLRSLVGYYMPDRPELFLQSVKYLIYGFIIDKNYRDLYYELELDKNFLENADALEKVVYWLKSNILQDDIEQAFKHEYETNN